MTGPIALGSNRPPERFYRGGRRITEFRGEPPAGDREPEDWVASTTTLAGETRLGLTTLPDGRRLVDAVDADPVGWLGQHHVDRFGTDIRLLVKLLDAGQRLPVHAHPHGSFAARTLGLAHGKAEAWFILEPGDVYVGLRCDVGADELAKLVATQNTERMLSLMHRVDVRPGDVVYVPPGVLHAIGAGVFLVEVQEPEDLSILLEWRGFELDGERDGHLGLGFELALEAVERTQRTPAQIAELARPAGFGASVLPSDADQYFRLERVRLNGEATLEPGLAIVVVTEGAARVQGLDAQQGSTILVPHSAGVMQLSGAGEVLVCRPPLP